MSIFTSNTENRFNEILFENRNKAYGAYELRNSESLILQKSLFIGIALFAGLALSPLIINSLSTDQIIIKADPPTFELKPVDEKPPIEPIKPQPQQQVKTEQSTVKIEIPTPVRDAVKQTPPPSVSEIDKSTIGHDNIVGIPPTTTYTPPVINTSGTQASPQTPVKPVDNSPAKRVDIEAKFAGGIDAFRNRVVQGFNTDDFEGQGELLKTTVTFIVEKDGSLSSVKANGINSSFNAEAEKTIKRIKGKWTPAKLDGEYVRSYFTFPISMQFE